MYTLFVLVSQIRELCSVFNCSMFVEKTKLPNLEMRKVFKVRINAVCAPYD